MFGVDYNDVEPVEYRKILMAIAKNNPIISAFRGPRLVVIVKF